MSMINMLNKCNRCGYEWKQRLKTTPIHCSKCNSPYWNKDRMLIERPKKDTVKKQACEHIGPGWHKLVNNLIDDLYAMRWDGIVVSAKSKHNGLWFHIGKGAKIKIHDRIRIAERKSFSKCEQCGKLTARAHGMSEWKCKCGSISEPVAV